MNVLNLTPVALPFALSMAVAVLLHTSSTRADVAWVVPAMWAWSVLGIGYVHRFRDRLPGLWPLLTVALMMRLTLVGTPLHLSDDLYRYLFEGLALGHGYSPFEHAPADLAYLAPDLSGRVNHPHISSAYPPLALAWFRLLDMLGGATWTAQLATALVDVGTVAILATCTPAGRTGAWLYALHPLAVIESGAGAHIDVIGVAALTIGLAAARRLGSHGEWLGIWLGAGTKLLPVVLIPWMLRTRPWKTNLAWLAVGPVALFSLTLLMVSLSGSLLDGLGAYAEHWSFNGFLFPWLFPVLGSATRPLLLLGAGIALLLAAVRVRELPRFWLVASLVFLLSSPTVHPWYGLWVLAPVAWTSRLDLAWIPTSLLGSYAVLSTWNAATASWTEPWWLWWLTWSPVVGALVASALRRTRPSQRLASA